jgi:hypothetical protein
MTSESTRRTRRELDRANWQALWEELDGLLAPLVDAGWALSDDEDAAELDSFGEVDPQAGPILWLARPLVWKQPPKTARVPGHPTYPVVGCRPGLSVACAPGPPPGPAPTR